MRLTRQRRQALALGAIALVALAGGALAAGIGFFDQNLQASVYDFALTTAPEQPKNQITIVGIDNATVDKYGRWPLPRQAYADLLKVLREAKPTIIAFDVAFYDRSDRPADDEALAREIKATGNVVLAMQGDGPRESKGGALHFERGLFPLPIFKDAAMGLAAANILPEVDGKARRAPLVVEVGKDRYYGMPLVAAAPQIKADTTRLRYEAGTLILPAPLGTRTIPVDEAGEMRVQFSAPPATDLAEQRGGAPCAKASAGELCVVSLADVVDGKVPQRLFANRIVLVGAHSISAVPDDYPTPNSGDRKMFGVEIWANTALSIVSNRFPVLREDTPITVLWIALITLVGIGLIVRFRLVGFFAALLVLVLYMVAGNLLFSVLINRAAGGVVHVPSIAYVATGAPFWWVVVLGYLLVEEQVSVRQTQRAFGLAVTPEIAKVILDMQDRGSLALGGQMREATVLFGDIRGFTTLSEGMGPADLMATLNRYFDGMVQIVQRYGGTVNKYNGDNIMVIWGAPISISDHARKAVECALELQRFIVSERGKGGPDVSFGFGINTGELIAGFLGAQGRFEYTVIGDTVNVASRLTSNDIAKRDNVAVSERTLGQLGEDVVAVDLGHVQVKGRAEPVHCLQVNQLGALVSPNPAPPPAEPIRAAAVAGFH